jgi:flagellar biosynthesis protein FlhF
MVVHKIERGISMRYVKIKANNYNEAMMKLKMDHGDEAIPISHKYIKEGGLFRSRLFAREIVELTAAIQERKRAIKPRDEKKSSIDITVDDLDGASKIIGSKIIDRLNNDDLRNKNNQRGFDGVEGQIHRKDDERRSASGQTAPNRRDNTVIIGEEELNSLKKFEKEFHEIKEKLNRLMENKGTEGNTVLGSTSEDDKYMKPYMEMLEHNEFDHEECITLIDQVKNSISKEDLKDKFKIEKTLKELMKSKIVTSGPINTGTKKKVIMFFGPTGVGKTTTMAKLGAIYALREGYRVSFVTIDNYRIAATEQLKKYAEIMKIPIFVVNDRESFKEIIDKEKSDIIMIDTSGRSHKNELKISEIKSFVEMIEYDFEKILCVSANTKKEDLVDVFKAFDILHFDSVIITKVDETSYIGNIIDVADKYNKPISYYTNGQEVPNDINVADPDKILSMIFEGVNI